MEQAGVFERLKNRDLTQREAAKQLGFSVRWVRTQLKRYKKSGPEGLIHGNSGKPSPRKIPTESVEIALDLLQTKLQGAGPTYLAEKLFELHGVKINEESMRQIMIQKGVWRISKARPKHRSRRARRLQVGIMVQLDGSPHDWFEGRGPRCTLLVFIDDATSRILWLEFVTGESVIGVMIATIKYLEKFGRPVSFYVDYGSVWSVNTNNPDRDKLTQFERAMKELDIQIIHARSPQAKGRVERANQTLQDRLIKDMRLAGISSREAANEFARDVYIPQHNARFAVEPADQLDAHRSLEGFDLRHIMSIREERTVQQDYVVVYRKQLFQLTERQLTTVRPKDVVTINTYMDGTMAIFIRQIKLEYMVISKRPQRPLQPEPARIETYHKPAKDHQWRTGVPTKYALRFSPEGTSASPAHSTGE